MAEAALRESEAFARSILEASTMAIEVLDTEGRLIFMNGPGIAIMEVDDFQAIKGLSFDQFWPDAGKAGDPRRHCRCPAGRDGAAHAVRADGQGQAVLVGYLDIADPRRGWRGGAAPGAIAGRHRGGKRNETEATENARRLSDVLESTMDSVLSLDLDWKITYLNRHAMTVFPESGGPYIGRDVHDFFDPVESEPFFSVIAGQWPNGSASLSRTICRPPMHGSRSRRSAAATGSTSFAT